MKKLFSLIVFICAVTALNAQSTATTTPLPLIYHPELDARAEMNKAIKTAKLEHKNVVLMIGGNWCKWCRRFQQFIDANAKIDSTLKSGFVFEHLNYSKENKNLDILAELNFPQRFGFPVFVILDADGKRIHTQNSGYLEDGDGYSEEKIIEFFSQWSPSALNPENYVEKK
ncbi:hypothetical protein BH11BAC2_BH11BAC2_02230 [soil metagenome]